MLKGSVSFLAAIKGNGVTFRLFEFNPKEPGVDKVEIEAPNGDEIVGRVHFVAVTSKAEARMLAARVTTIALNRIAFIYNLVMETARLTSDHFTRLASPPGVIEVESGDVVSVGGEARLVRSLQATTVKAELEQQVFPGEHNYGLFCFVTRLESPVEEFMFLYNLLLRFFNDSQENVDQFIVGVTPAVPTTPSPRKAGATETVYRRLRNEVGHYRPGATPEKTRKEVAENVAGLRALTKRAIESDL